MGSPKKIQELDRYPFLVKQDSVYNPFVNRPLENIDHQFLKNVECQVTRQNASSSSSSSSSPPIFNNLGTLSIDHHRASVSKSPIEMTNAGDIIEEFLMRQGGLNGEGNNFMSRIDHQVVSQWENEGVVEPKYNSVSENSFKNKMMDLGYLDEQLKMPITIADKGSDSQGGMGNKDDLKDERMAKSIERRQRRMIKNRESAARSRAKKQAYTNRLQNSLSQLQTANNLLKKRKAADLLLDSSSTSGPRIQLRRTSSSTF